MKLYYIIWNTYNDKEPEIITVDPYQEDKDFFYLKRQLGIFIDKIRKDCINKKDEFRPLCSSIEKLKEVWKEKIKSEVNSIQEKMKELESNRNELMGNYLFVSIDIKDKQTD